MVFASGIFLFIFLPITIAGNWLLRNQSAWLKNAFLLIMSAVFYLESGVGQFLLLVMSIIVNYSFAILINEMCLREYFKIKKLLLAISITFNIGILFIFKYMTFVLGEMSFLFDNNLPSEIESIVLPLGISFYTFQAMSYVIDVYRDNNKLEKNIINVALYIMFFPQLVAGPIVRWDSIRTELTMADRKGKWNEGLERFTLGLAKKVIIANQMAVFADKAFSLLEEGNLTVAFAWLGAISYTLQIYYDFSGYSDMAIGLGKMFGFNFPNNFNYPYISKSITEFWRRWHISLSSWFRDYVYIPLGGNRCSKQRMFFNLFIVWMLTGIWHGANYTFWVWGLLYFVFLVIEKNFLNGNGKQKSNALLNSLAHFYTMIVVIFLWVIFRADSIGQAANYIMHMLGRGKVVDSLFARGVTELYFRNFIGYGVLAVLGCMPWYIKVKEYINCRLKPNQASAISQVWIILVFVLACCVTIDSDYNPFIYFNF